MRIGTLFLASCLTLIGLSGCGGGVSGENGDDPFGTGSPNVDTVLKLTLLDENCNAVQTQSFMSGDTICLQATLTQNDNIVSGEIIDFASGLGQLSVSTKLTDSNGVAQISLVSNVAEIGASTVVASIAETTAEVNFELLSNEVAINSLPTITISMLSNGQAVNRFQANKSVQLQATLLDANDQAIENEIVVFSAGKGALSTSEALTNNLGIAQVTLSAVDGDLGALVVSAQTVINELPLLDAINVEIQAVDAVEEQIVRLGYFTTENIFVEGEIGVSALDDMNNVAISAGGALGLSVALVDQNEQRVLTQTPINFSSNCVADGKASIESLVNTINGIAQATFEDINCAGSAGIDDIITASAAINNDTISISRAFSIQAENIGSIRFLSATPQNIVLNGTGGQNTESVSTLVFQVQGELGNPLAQQQVTFSLNTETGGLTLSPLTAVTNSQGQVSTRVKAGNVPTSVRVSAQVTGANDNIISSQSDLLAVSTGLPDQNSFTLSADVLNPEAHTISGQTVNITARLADTFNNPVPDGTAVSCTTEGGAIESSCVTANGNCSVVWTSADPRVANHRITILATAIGHETLFDANGNNSYEDSDGGAIIDNTASGFGVSAYGTTGFVDHSEAWRDDDEDNFRDASEIFLDYNSDGSFSPADAIFNGPQCVTGNNCGEGIQSSLHVRKALVLIMSSSRALMDILNSNNSIIFSNHQNASQPDLSIEAGSSLRFRLRFSDSAIQPIANGSQITIETTAGSLIGQISTIMPSTNNAGTREIFFTLVNDVSEAVDSIVSAIITSPSGNESRVDFNVQLNL